MRDSAWRGTAGRVREAIVLAGGFGTRLAHVVPGVCKPMAPVAGEPFLRRILDRLDSAGFARVVIADGHLREQIESYFSGTYRGLEVVYSSEDYPLLTGGATKKALSNCDQDEVFVLNGDTWFDVDFAAMEKTFSEHNEAKCCIAVKRMYDFSRYGVVEVDGKGVIRGFLEKRPCSDGRINGGVYLIRHDALVDEPDSFSLEEEWFKTLERSGLLVACECEGEFVDIGVPEDYERAQRMLFDTPETCNLALFDRDGTINVDVGHLNRKEECEFVSQTIEIMRRYTKDPLWRIAVVSNQAGIARGLYSESDMRSLHRWMAAQLRSLGVEIDAWYYCPHHPSFTGDCGCRKPLPGMLLRAMRDFRTSSSSCVMYGDKGSDEAAARAAGVEFCGMGKGELVFRQLCN